MKIGVSTKALGYWWYKDIDFDVVEIGRSGALFFDTEWIDKNIPKGLDYSVHSKTKKVFSDVSQFTRAETEMLKAEIVACDMIGAKELVFHLKNKKLTETEGEALQEVIDFSKEHNVKMVYESPSKLRADVSLDVLQRFDVGYNLDLGHLNCGVVNETIGCSMDEFIERVKDRVMYVHAHNNYGKDDHLALNNGSLDWKRVLDKLDLNDAKVVIEVKNREDVMNSKRELEEYFGC